MVAGAGHFKTISFEISDNVGSNPARIKKPLNTRGLILKWLRGLDLNQRPSGYEPDELPDCSTPR